MFGAYLLRALRADGSEARVQISSTPLGPEGRAIGMFGLAVPQARSGRAAPRPNRRLTPRQQEILGLLADGASTDHIAEQLHLSRETVRNHVRHILGRLGARSRLEAVAIGHRDGLI